MHKTMCHGGFPRRAPVLKLLIDGFANQGQFSGGSIRTVCPPHLPDALRFYTATQRCQSMGQAHPARR